MLVVLIEVKTESGIGEGKGMDCLGGTGRSNYLTFLVKADEAAQCDLVCFALSISNIVSC